MPNIFETLSEGRFIDLGSRLTPAEIEILGSRPFRVCPECEGKCVVGMAMALSAEGMLFIPLPCDVCEGAGEVVYYTSN